MKQKQTVSVLAAIGVAVFPGFSYANGIIPYMFVPVAQIMIFLGVVIIEAIFIERVVALRWWPSVLWSFVANLISTLAGLVSYIALMGIFGPSMSDYSVQNIVTGFVVLSLVITIVLFIGSWVIESLVVWWFIKGIKAKQVWKALLAANLLTYCSLFSLNLLSEW